MAEGKRSDLNKDEQTYMLAKVALTHYGIMHEYFMEQMKMYTVACCNISVGGEFEIVLAEKYIKYKVNTERHFKMNGARKSKVASLISMTPAKYEKEREIAARNLVDWTKNLLSWPTATIKVEIDGREQQQPQS